MVPLKSYCESILRRIELSMLLSLYLFVNKKIKKFWVNYFLLKLSSLICFQLINLWEKASIGLIYNMWGFYFRGCLTLKNCWRLVLWDYFLKLSIYPLSNGIHIPTLFKKQDQFLSHIDFLNP